jgi:uncharacterized protein YggE
MRRLLPCLAILAFMSVPVPAQEPPRHKLERLITMSGAGEVTGTPDRADISIGVTSFAVRANDALTANTAAMQKVMDGLKAAGIALADLQTAGFSVNPRMSYDPQGGKPPKLEGYDVSNELRVTVRDLAKLGYILDAAVADGSNAVNGLSFSVSKPESLLAEARRKAMEDALSRAKLYAEVAGARLGEVVTISEEMRDIVQPMAVRMDRMAAESAPVPVAPGQQTVRASVTAVWRLE